MHKVTAEFRMVVKKVNDCGKWHDVISKGNATGVMQWQAVKWNPSKMVTVLGSHLTKTASLPGPK